MFLCFESRMMVSRFALLEAVASGGAEKRVTGKRRVRRKIQATFTFSAQPGALTVKLTLLRSTVFAAIASLALMPMRTL